MPIRFRPSVDPSFERPPQDGTAIILAPSDAKQVLLRELLRYCGSEISGRSFLIAGHRGAGKTTMVAHAISEAHKEERGSSTLKRPLPILLHGPSLFRALPSEKKEIKEAENAAAAKQGARESPASLSNIDVWIHDPAGGRKPAEAVPNGDDAGIEAQARIALEQVILGLHRAAAKEFASRYRTRILELARGQSADAVREAAELAAQFEMEILEDPPASRLREFWERANVMDSGVLFAQPRNREDQGARELVALNGICNAHQRISGDLREKDERQRSQSTLEESTRGADAKTMEALKPMASVLSGAVVAGGTAVGTSGWLLPVVLGILTVAGSSLILRSTSVATQKRSRQVDRTFMPDLSWRTLDRVLPIFLERLRAAGLAPVFVIDELDKVQELSRRIGAMIHYLKKLVAENVFSVFIADRSYFEHLRITGSGYPYDPAFSYFSHRLLVAHGPGHMDEYLTRVLVAEAPAPKEQVSEASPAATKDDGRDEQAETTNDLMVLKWQLRHRAELHALDLARALDRLRTPDGAVDMGLGAVRSLPTHRIEVTLQVALELQILSPAVSAKLAKRPDLRGSIFDALYYLSRCWKAGAGDIVLDTDRRDEFKRYLFDRLDLAREDRTRGEKALTPDEVFSADDVDALWGIVVGMCAFLDDQPKDVKALWDDALERSKPEPILKRATDSAEPTPPSLPDSVIGAMLGGPKSLLIREWKSANNQKYWWRYSDVGEVRRERRSLQDRVATANGARSSIENFEAKLWLVLRRPAEPATPDGTVYAMLAGTGRLLRTSPAWPIVKAASRNVALADGGKANVATLASDCGHVSEFYDNLLRNAPAVAHALYKAAFLAGASQEPDVASAIRNALQLLSTGLQFAPGDPDAVGRLLDQFKWQIEGQGFAMSIPAPATDGDVVIQSEDIADGVRRAVDEGRRFAMSATYVQISDTAWERLYPRAVNYATSNAEDAADAAEILCAMTNAGPAAYVPISLSSMSLSDWTRVLSGWARVPVPQPNAPTWLTAIALQRLGIANLRKDLAEAIFNAHFGSVPHPELDQLRDLAFTKRLWVGRNDSAQVVILVRKARNSMSTGWAKPPSRGLMLIVEQGVAFNGPFLPKNASVTVVWEQPLDFTSPNMPSIGPVSVAPVREVYLYDSKPPPTSLPSIVAPENADDVFVKLAQIVESPTSA